MSKQQSNSDSADIGNIWQQLQLVWQLIRDPETPTYLKLLPIGAVIYWIFPLEGLGIPVLATPLDDIAILYAAVRGFINMAPPHLVARYTNQIGATNIVEGELVNDKDLDESIVIDPD